ncbi:MAG: hypothetical protein R3B49_10345, partial [Phycisphaerales bacterium]
FMSETAEQWLLNNEKREGVPYTIVVSKEVPPWKEVLGGSSTSSGYANTRNTSGYTRPSGSTTGGDPARVAPIERPTAAPAPSTEFTLTWYVLLNAEQTGGES